VVPGWCRGGRGVQSALLSIANAYASQPQAIPNRRQKAECRMQKGRAKSTKATCEPAASQQRASSEPAASQQRGTSEAPASHPHASLKLPSGSPRATPRLPWSQVQAGSLRETRSCFACIPLVFGLCSVRVPLVFRLYSAYMPLILVGPRKGKGGGAGWKRGVAWSGHRSQPTHIASFT